ncbi:MAG TPA: hypothetical protein VG294_02140 [Solirubrobacteraceae bacterium]|jgi:hypothetical protein|nr:hypothetical protein [Solirubrobacteraceae bacterium]
MPAVAVITLILVGAAVAVIATYLIYIALILYQVVARLNKIVADVGETGQQAAPIGPVAGAINADLEAAARALHGSLPPDIQGMNGDRDTRVGARSQ